MHRAAHSAARAGGAGRPSCKVRAEKRHRHALGGSFLISSKLRAGRCTGDRHEGAHTRPGALAGPGSSAAAPSAVAGRRPPVNQAHTRPDNNYPQRNYNSERSDRKTAGERRPLEETPIYARGGRGSRKKRGGRGRRPARDGIFPEFLDFFLGTRPRVVSDGARGRFESRRI
ncbi:hypothetical protein EVAR_22723_1 [Eumeta japonica]|uniref:Uncharacterized protein n=1 Tax=Eumeta variegata TaxID=151549 RepID=A0A4C1USA5_EUMVA|nr:hypothetical protein EVAR_22723_1 [Eumeta japonica]